MRTILLQFLDYIVEKTGVHLESSWNSWLTDLLFVNYDSHDGIADCTICPIKVISSFVNCNAVAACPSIVSLVADI
jgi:hypothetical protein